MTLMRCGLAVAATVWALGSAGAENAMSIEFTWAGIRGCMGSGKSPSFLIQNAPAGTSSMLIALDGMNRDYGGEEIAFPSDGRIVAGALYTNTPCNQGDYRWTAVAKDVSGKTLATATSTRRFPD